jgi:hypothetical protein
MYYIIRKGLVLRNCKWTSGGYYCENFISES